MKLCLLLTLAATLTCLAAPNAHAQSGRAKRSDPPGVGRGGTGGGDQSPEAGGPDKSARREDYTRVFTTREVTQRARITRRPVPGYPREARRNQVAGTVVLRLVLRSDGRVGDKIEVLKSLPYGITEEAIKVAKQIEFEPAQKDGRKVSQYVTVEYNFNVY